MGWFDKFLLYLFVQIGLRFFSEIEVKKDGEENVTRMTFYK